jgi:hypothetical protein
MTERARAIAARLPASEALDPRFFGPGDDLDPAVRSKLLAAADDALAGLKDMWPDPPRVVQRILTGSETGGDYDELSDLDLHLVVDLSTAPNPRMAKGFLDAYAKVFNGRGLRIKGRPVELYFQDSAGELVAPGVYDLDAGAWARHPDDVSRHEPGQAAVDLARAYADQARALRAEWDTSDRSLADQARGFQERARALRDAIRAMRAKALAQGLQSDGNQAFRLLRRNGGFDALQAVLDGTRAALLGDGE